MGFDPQKLGGWVEDSAGIKACADENGALSQVASSLMGGEQRDVLLPLALLKVHPSWRRFAQGIGDCVSWGAELAATVLMAIDAVEGTGSWEGEAATEPIYGGCRVEALGKQRGGRSDGAFGYAAAKWLKNWGVVLRKDYSSETGNREHDLRKYSKNKAKDWGDYGCGGRSDGGELDSVAKRHPVSHIAQVKTVEEAIASISNAYPFTIASAAGFGKMRRNAEGLCFWTSRWMHQMLIAGLRWRNGKPQFRCFQSWGDSCSGPDPGIQDMIDGKLGLTQEDETPFGIVDSRELRSRLILPSYLDDNGNVIEWGLEAGIFEGSKWNPISACSWWIDESTMAKILRTGDCWTFSGVSGFEPRKLDVMSLSDEWLDI